jgi:Icc protein
VIGSDVRLRSVVFGHAHQDVEGNCANVPVYGAPSTCFQFKPGSEKFALDTLSPGYRWLYLTDDGGVTTQIRRVESFSIHVQLDA